MLLSWLTEAGHPTKLFTSASHFLRAIRGEPFELVLLDWGLPDISGDRVVTELRQSVGWQGPVIFVTARDREQDVVEALGAGADDYMSKPVKRGETLARIAAALRRASAHETVRAHTFEPFGFDAAARQATRDGEAVALTDKEFDLAVYLFKNSGRLLSRGHILEAVWSTRPDLNTRTVDTHVSRIRRKLGIDPASGWRLRAVYQHGYRLERTGLGNGADQA